MVDKEQRNNDNGKPQESGPPYREKPRERIVKKDEKPSAVSKPEQSAPQAAGKERMDVVFNTIIPPLRQDKSKEAKKPEAGQGQKEASDVPKFDLADDMMAEYRRHTGERRQRISRKSEVEKAEASDKENKPEKPQISEDAEQRIIAEIVARDIERFCQGE